jgi:hypothetical protein
LSRGVCRNVLLGLVLIVPGAVGLGLSAAKEPEPSKDRLRQIEARGHLLFRLDQMAADSTDALRDLGAELTGRGLYICREEAEAIACVFGSLEEGGELQIHYETRKHEDGTIAVGGQSPQRSEGAFWSRAANAVRLAAAAFPFDRSAEAYNHVVVPEEDEVMSVYFYPSTDRPRVRVLGADGVVTVRADGSTELTRFHTRLQVTELPEDESEMVAGAHTHVLASEPNPLDVLYVLTPPVATEYILGRHWAFEVDETGTITPLGNTEEFVNGLRAAREGQGKD